MAKREGFFTRENFDKVGMKKLSLIGLVILAFIALVFLVTRPAPVPGVSAAGTINFALNPNTNSLYVGQTVGVPVLVSSATDLYGVDVSVVYDGSILNYTGYSEGTFLNASGTVNTYVPDTYTTYSNNVSHLVITRLGNVSGANGNGTVMTLYFKGLALGTSSLKLVPVASDSNSTSISINSITNASVNVVPGSADVTPPTLTLDSPINTYNSSSQSVTFHVTAQDGVALKNVSLYGNWGGSWSSKAVDSSPTNGGTTSFSVSVPEGKYSWNAYACDNSSNCAFANSAGETLANNSLTVDTTKPTVIINSPTNTTLGSTTVPVNISYTDNLGLSKCSYNITNMTGYPAVANNFVPCANPHIESPSPILEGGIYILNAFANDSAGNIDTSSVVFTVPIVPLLNFTASKFSITTGQNTVLTWNAVNATSCTASDGWSGAKNTAGSQTVSPGSTKTYTLTCQGTGGNVSKSVKITVTSASSGGSSSGGGGGGSSSSSTTTTTNNVTSTAPVTSETHTTLGVLKSVLYFSPSTGVKQISLWFGKRTLGASVSVDKFDARPAAVPVALNHKVYRWLKISLHNDTSHNFNNATTILQVQNTWLKTNGIANQNVALYEFDNATNQWNQLETEYNSSDAVYSYYIVNNQTHFSYFAIAQETSHLYLYLGIIGGALVLVIIVVFIIREMDKKKGRENMLQNLSKS